MKHKINIAIIFGGCSAEHEVSLESAKQVIAALDTNKYHPILIEIDREGRWTAGHHNALASADVAFPVMHGPYCEDGAIQGLLKMMHVPCVGAGILGSAVAFDKEFTKRLLQQSGLSVANYLVATKSAQISFERARKILGLPLFVKPCSLGSSVGVSKVRNSSEFSAAIDLAFLHDSKVLIEEAISGREVECGILGTDASVVGEIPVRAELYTYEEKYVSGKGDPLIIPAAISAALAKKIQRLALGVFASLGLGGMARIDFFLKENGDLVVNEANTIPGFKESSMYPRLWKESGLSYGALIEKLISLALER